MYDPANYGTPLTMLQIPAKAIQKIQEKSDDVECTLTYYTQDCRHFADLKKSVSADDWAVARRASVDVGYICKKCHIVYPGRSACVAHQQATCYQGSKGEETGSVLKLEQLQYECGACRVRCSTVGEYKTHCSQDSHRRVTATCLHGSRSQTQSVARSLTPSTSRSLTPGAGRSQTPSAARSQTPSTSRSLTPASGKSQTPCVGRSQISATSAQTKSSIIESLSKGTDSQLTTPSRVDNDGQRHGHPVSQ